MYSVAEVYKMQYLILGADGFIGKYILKRMKEDGLSVIGTSRKTEKNGSLIYYDMVRENLDSVMQAITEREKTAIICIAESNIDRCYINYENAYQINVILTKQLISQLVHNGFHVIFFSSDNVFDGISGNYFENSKTAPVNAYGEMKQEIENYLLQNKPEVCILRLPKVISAEKEKHNLLYEWDNQIRQKEIRCIKGNVLSIVYIEDVYQTCVLSAQQNLCGLYHIAGNQAYSRKTLAEKFCEVYGAKNVKIAEYGIESFSFKDARRPLNVSMNNRKFVEKTGYEFVTAECVFRQYMKSRK